MAKTSSGVHASEFAKLAVSIPVHSTPITAARTCYSEFLHYIHICINM